MTHKWVSARVACALSLVPAVLLAPTACAAPQKLSAAKAAAPEAPHSKNVHPATLVSIDDTTVHVTLDGGDTLDAEIRPSSAFLIGGMEASPSDFKPGARVLLRTRTRASDGTVSVVMLSDPATSAAIETYRRRPLVGHVVTVEEKTLVVQPSGTPSTPVTLHVTPKTVFRKGGADATAAAFPVGSGVSVITRGLPSGLLMASIVSDRVADAQAEKSALKPVSLVGTAVEVQEDKGLLVLAPKTKPRQTVAVLDTTKIKVEKTDAMLHQITPGMRVSVRLGRQKDADGHSVATSLSAYTLTPKPLHKKTVPAKKP